MHVWPCEEGGTFIIDHGGGRERESEKKRPYPVSNHNVSNLNTTKTLKLKVGCIYLVS